MAVMDKKISPLEYLSRFYKLIKQFKNGEDKIKIKMKLNFLKEFHYYLLKYFLNICVDCRKYKKRKKSENILLKKSSSLKICEF